MWLILFIFIFLFNQCVSFEPITTGFAVAGIAALLGALKKSQCYVQECCNDRWTNHNVSGLHKALEKYVFGQHLVNNVVSNVVRKHVENKNSKKALVLSFHGWTGSGKNYVADIIAKHVFREGTKSKFVHKKISTLHYPHTNDISKYKEELKTYIQTCAKKCGRAMFIFDEMDKMPEGLPDVLKPFLDYHPVIEDVDYRNLIFIFLSNTGGDKINKETLSQFNNGLPRDDITSQRMERILSLSSFNMAGGMKNSDLILSGLVDFFVPFLPLERRHVRQCAKAAVKERNEEVEERVLDCVEKELQYFPSDSKIFSKTGCKQVEKKVDGC